MEKEKWYQIPRTNTLVSETELRAKGQNPDDFQEKDVYKLSGKVSYKALSKILKQIKNNKN